ncbi:hypothetical protein [Nocardia noduli]|uniref:hypothetical protein n=1 Tax=Nocardia noduli TaxID=2815722 RepID=UPI001C21A405|nr:hypothetical protein [Nocardia noduli]
MSLPCDAAAATGRVFTLERNQKQPFSVRLPELPGWQRNRGPGESADGVGLQRRDTLPDDFRSPTAMITLSVGSPVDSVQAAVVANRRTAETGARDWRTREDQSIAACGFEGGRVTGVFSGGEWWEDQRVIVCGCGGTVYPVLLSAKTKIADLDRFEGEMAAILDGVQIVE